MNPNENLVKHPKEDEEEFVEEEEDIDESKFDFDDDDDKSVSSSSAAKNKMMKFMGAILLITILLLIVLFVFSSMKPKVYKYTEIETMLKNAAMSYFKDFPESLPQNEGSIVEIDSSNLVNAGKMKDLSEYTAEGVVCSGTVQVELAGSDYVYTPYLNCGENYSTVELYKKIIDESNIVTAGYGLYSSGGSYVYKGEEVNNFVQLDRMLWRIVKITPDNNIVLIANEITGYGTAWDDRYNEAKSYEAGINQYSVSRIYDYLKKVYENPSKDKEDNELILSNRDKTRLVSYDLCVGKRGQNEEGKDNKIECAQKLKNQRLGLLTVSDYMNASLDPNCKTTLSKTCKNYNYLSKYSNFWLVTADKDDNSQAYQINQGGKIVKSIAAGYAGVRPVVYLNSKVLYRGGNGTFEKPYKVK